MTKTVIDADALKAWVNEMAYSGFKYWGLVVADAIIQKIDELSTPMAQEGDEVNKSYYNLDKNKNFMG